MTVQELVELLDDYGDQTPVVIQVDGTEYEVTGVGGDTAGRCVIIEIV
jgi:hypothetical protein